jgi:hypothetical protein
MVDVSPLRKFLCSEAIKKSHHKAVNLLLLFFCDNHSGARLLTTLCKYSNAFNACTLKNIPRTLSISLVNPIPCTHYSATTRQ